VKIIPGQITYCSVQSDLPYILLSSSSICNRTDRDPPGAGEEKANELKCHEGISSLVGVDPYQSTTEKKLESLIVSGKCYHDGVEPSPPAAVERIS